MSEITISQYTLAYITDVIAEKVVEKLNDKGGLKWHDLRKDPFDLPSEDGFYIACVEHPKNRTRTTREIRFSIRPNSIVFWERNNRFVNKESVIAWRYIEQFEEVSE